MTKSILSKAIGIDLGTTNSVVAIMDPTDTEIVLHNDQAAKRETTPSCVWKDPKSGQVIVGRKAYSRIGNHPKPIRSIKRKMGQTDTVTLTNEQATPEEISAHILREMRRQIEEDIVKFGTATSEWIVDRAIITVPAYFDLPQIEATRKAAEMAGLQCVELLHEPTAAASYYCWETKTLNGIFLVYDLGGGTFDVSILRCTEGVFEVLAIQGDKMYGGDDIDALLAEEIRTRLVQEGYDLELDYENEEDKLRLDKLKLLAEGVKKGLSYNTDFVLRDTTTLQDKSGEHIDIDLVFERAEFEKIIHDFVEGTMPHCFAAIKQANEKAGITLADIDQIILAGGSTHIPLVQATVKKYLCAGASVNEPRAKCDAPAYKKVDTIVGLGAAIRAAATGGLIVYNPEKTVRVSFRGISITGAKQTHIGGTVESLASDIDLMNGRIRLQLPTLNFEDEQDLKANGAFGFTRIPLQTSTSNFFIFEVYDHTGEHVATLERTINQTREAVRPTGGSTGTAVLSKDIKLDVVTSSGEFDNVILIPALTTLPAKATHPFYYRENPIRLPLYQDTTPIVEIYVFLKDEPPYGTPLLLEVEINNLSHISVQVYLAQNTYRYLFETELLPIEPTLPVASSVQKLEQAFRAAIAPLPAGQRATQEAQFKRAKQGYEDALKRDETDRAIHGFEQMKKLLADLQSSTKKAALEPEKSEFDALVRNCLNYNRQVAAVSSQLDQPHDYNEMLKIIEMQRAQGEQAFKAGDQDTYTDAVEMLKSIHDYLNSLLSQIRSANDTRTEEEKLSDAIAYYQQQASTLDLLAAQKQRQDLREQIQQIKQQLQEASQIVQQNSYRAREKMSQQYILLEQLQNILGQKKAQNLNGLVEDRRLHN